MISPTKGILKHGVAASSHDDRYVPNYDSSTTSTNRTIKAMSRPSFGKLSRPTVTFSADEWETAKARFFTKENVSQSNVGQLYSINEHPLEEEGRSLMPERTTVPDRRNSEKYSGTVEKTSEVNIQEPSVIGGQIGTNSTSQESSRMSHKNYPTQARQSESSGLATRSTPFPKMSTCVRSRNHTVARNKGSVSNSKTDPSTEVYKNVSEVQAHYEKDEEQEAISTKLPSRDSRSKVKEISSQGAKPKVFPKSNFKNRKDVCSARTARLAQRHPTPAPKEIYKLAKREIQSEQRRNSAQHKLGARASLTELTLNKNLTTARLTKFIGGNIPAKSHQPYFYNPKLSLGKGHPGHPDSDTGSETEMMSDFPLGQISSQKLSEIGSSTGTLINRNASEIEMGRIVPESDKTYVKDRRKAYETKRVVSPPYVRAHETTDEDPICSSAVVQEIESKGETELWDHPVSEAPSYLLMSEELQDSICSLNPESTRVQLDEAVPEICAGTEVLTPTFGPKSETPPEKIALPRNITFVRKQNLPPLPRSALSQKNRMRMKEKPSTNSTLVKANPKEVPNARQRNQPENFVRKTPKPATDLKAGMNCSKTNLVRSTNTTPAIRTPSKSHVSISAATKTEESNVRSDRQNSRSPKKELVVKNVTLVPRLTSFRSKLASKNKSPLMPRRKTTKDLKHLSLGKNTSLDENINSLINLDKESKQTEQREWELDLPKPAGIRNQVESQIPSHDEYGSEVSEMESQGFSSKLTVDFNTTQLSTVLDKKQSEGKEIALSTTEDEKKNVLPVVSVEKIKSRLSGLQIAEIPLKETKQSKSEIFVGRKISDRDMLTKSPSEHYLPTVGDGESQLEEKSTTSDLRRAIVVDAEIQRDPKRAEMDFWKNRVNELLKMRLMSPPVDWYLSGKVQEGSYHTRKEEKSPVKSASEKLAEIGAKIAALQRREAAAKAPAKSSNVEEIDTVTGWQKSTHNFYKEQTELQSDASDTKLEAESPADGKSPVSGEPKSIAPRKDLRVKKSTRAVKSSNDRTKDVIKRKPKLRKKTVPESDETNWAQKIRPGLSDMNMEFLTQTAASLSKTMYGRGKRQETPFVSGKKDVPSLSKNDLSPKKPALTSKLDDNSEYHRLSSDGTRRRINAPRGQTEDPVRVPPPGRRTFMDDIMYPGYKSPPPVERSISSMVKSTVIYKRPPTIPVSPFSRDIASARSRKSGSLRKRTPKKSPSKKLAKSSTTSSLLTHEKDAELLLAIARNQPVPLETGTLTSVRSAKSGKRKIRKASSARGRAPSTFSGNRTTPAQTPTSRSLRRVPSKRVKKKKNMGQTQKVQFFKKQFQVFAKRGDKRNSGNAITLANTKKWLRQAGIIDHKRVTANDVETYFIHYTGRRRSLPLVDFLLFLRTVAAEKNLSVQEITEQLLDCGPPFGSTTDMAIAAMFEDPEKTAEQQLEASPTTPRKHLSPKRAIKRKRIKERREITNMVVTTLVENSADLQPYVKTG